MSTQLTACTRPLAGVMAVLLVHTQVAFAAGCEAPIPLRQDCQPGRVVATPNPPDQEPMPVPPPIRYAPGLEEPLVAISPVRAQENKELDAALAAYRAAPEAAGPESDFSEYAKPLHAYLDMHSAVRLEGRAIDEPRLGLLPRRLLQPCHSDV